MAVRTSKYLAFEQVMDGVWLVKNKRSGDVLGGIEWYSPWRQYVFEAESSLAVFNHECLSDIAEFLRDANAEHRRGAA